MPQSIRAHRFPPFAVVLAVCAVLASAGQTPQRSSATVSIVASAFTKRGMLVPDLTQDDFEVLDNGKRQPLTVFENKVQPIVLVLLVDRSGTLGWDPAVVWQAAERLVAASVLPGDKARVGTFSSKIVIAPPDFTSDRDALLKVLHESIQGAGGAPLWNAASAAIDALAAQEGRRVLLVVSENRDAPDKAGAGATLADVRARAQAHDVVVYAIGLAAKMAQGALAPMSQGQGRRGGSGSSGGEPGSAKTSSDAGMPDPGLKILTSETGGDYFEFESGISLPDSFEFIAAELHHQYLLGFTPAVLDGKIHALEVRVKRSGVTVRSRKTYVAPAGK